MMKKYPKCKNSGSFVIGSLYDSREARSHGQQAIPVGAKIRGGSHNPSQDPRHKSENWETRRRDSPQCLVMVEVGGSIINHPV